MSQIHYNPQVNHITETQLRFRISISYYSEMIHFPHVVNPLNCESIELVI
jgi:hypothetical protein